MFSRGAHSETDSRSRCSERLTPGSERLEGISAHGSIDKHINGLLRTRAGGRAKVEVAEEEEIARHAADRRAEAAVGGCVIEPQPCGSASVSGHPDRDAHEQRDAQGVARLNIYWRQQGQVDHPQDRIVKPAAAAGNVVESARTHRRTVLEHLGRKVKPGSHIVAVLQSEPHIGCAKRGQAGRVHVLALAGAACVVDGRNLFTREGTVEDLNLIDKTVELVYPILRPAPNI